jgi:hypothetical protein
MARLGVVQIGLQFGKLLGGHHGLFSRCK